MEISRKDIDFLKQLSIANSLVQVNQIPLNLKKELNNTIISKSSFNMVIQFNKLTDVSGISAIYKFVDRRTIEDINNIKSYKIYPFN